MLQSIITVLVNEAVQLTWGEPARHRAESKKMNCKCPVCAEWSGANWGELLTRGPFCHSKKGLRSSCKAGEMARWVFKGICCSCRGLEFRSRHLGSASQLQFQGIQGCLKVFSGTRHTHSVKPLYTSNKSKWTHPRYRRSTCSVGWAGLIAHLIAQLG